MIHKKIIVALITLTAAILLFCENTGNNKKNGLPGAVGSRRSTIIPPVKGFVVKPSAISRSAVFSGTIKPFEETVLMPEVSGRIVAISIQEGQPVKKGMLLVKIFDADLQAQLRKAKAELAIASQTKNRLAELLKINGVSRSDFDNAVLKVTALDADVELLNVQINKTEVLAPYNGVLGLKQISVGAQVTPSTPLCTIRSIEKLKLDFSVPEKYSSYMQTGRELTFSVDGDTASYRALVSATEEKIESTTRNLTVRAIVDRHSTTLTPGAFARVNLILEADNNALMIPTHALIPEERSKRVIVARSGKAMFITVTTGIRLDSLVEIISGLTSGDTVVTTGILFIKPGSALTFSGIMR